MTRCVTPRTRRRACLALGLGILGALGAPHPAGAERPPDHRVFPAQALRGELVITSANDVQVNSVAERLAPGARIRGEDNQLLLSAGLIGQRLLAHYTREKTSGLLMEIWVLRPVERNNRPWPTTELEAQAWTFDPASQIWRKP